MFEQLFQYQSIKISQAKIPSTLPKPLSQMHSRGSSSDVGDVTVGVTNTPLVLHVQFPCCWVDYFGKKFSFHLEEIPLLLYKYHSSPSHFIFVFFCCILINTPTLCSARCSGGSPSVCIREAHWRQSQCLGATMIKNLGQKSIHFCSHVQLLQIRSSLSQDYSVCVNETLVTIKMLLLPRQSCKTCKTLHHISASRLQLCLIVF